MLKVTKTERLTALRILLATHELSSQEDVVKAMAKRGIEMTQATLSRDFKLLKVAKTTNGSGKRVYSVPEETAFKRVHKEQPKRTDLPLAFGYVSLQFSGNMGVIRTKPGFASSIASNIDNAGLNSIIGTIAGDDTIFFVMNENASIVEVTEQLSSIIPDMVV